MEILFWRHQTKGQRRRGTCSLYCRVTLAGERVEIGSVGVSIDFDQFDTDSQQVLHTCPEATLHNEKLTMLRADLLSIHNELLRRREPFSAETIKHRYLNQDIELTTRLMDAMDRWLNDEILSDLSLTKSTKKAYRNVRNKLLEYLIARRRQKMALEDFDSKELMAYRKWLKNQPTRTSESHEDSTLRKHIATIKQMASWCKLQKITATDMLADVKVPREVVREPVRLTLKQFHDLRTHTFKNKDMQEAADIFILYCRTGFHDMDLKLMAKQHQTAIRESVGGRKIIDWGRLKLLKQNKRAVVPLLPEAVEIVEKYGGWDKLPFRSNQKMNDWLKLIAAEMGWTGKLEKLSVKIGRNTMADYLLNELHWSREAVKVVLGTRTDRCLDRYVREDERRIDAEMERSFS